MADKDGLTEGDLVEDGLRGSGALLGARLRLLGPLLALGELGF